MKKEVFNDKSVKYDIIGKYSTEEILFTDNVEKLENNAFKDCFNLKKIIWGKNIIRGGMNVFENCKNIEIVDIFDESSFLKYCCDNYSSPLQYGAKLYIQGNECSVFVIPNNIENINRLKILFGCSSIKEMHISKDNPYYKEIIDLFKDTSKLIKEIKNFSHAFDNIAYIPKIVLY